MTAAKTWRDAFLIYAQPQVLGMIFLGFSAGLPFLLVFSTLSAWLRDEGVELSVIGFFSWIGVTYSIKVFWAPVVDRLALPLLSRWLGKRRSWMLLAQLGIALGLFVMGGLDVKTQLELIALLAVWVAFCSATQDIVIDAYRIEAAVAEYQGAMAATYVLGYRIALLVAGAGAFYLANYFNWSIAYDVMAGTMLVGVIATLSINEPDHILIERHLSLGLLGQDNAQEKGLSLFLRWLKDIVLSPFVEFFVRNGKRSIFILMLIALYKMSDITMGVMANPFYLDLGFTKKEIADVSKIFGFFMTIAGASLGGVLVVKLGIMRALLLGAVMVAVTNLLFAVLAATEPSLVLLASVVSADNLSGGMATSIFIAYLSGLTSKLYTATQYALFSSLMTLPAQLLGGFSGIVVERYGYFVFFGYAAAVGVPAIVLSLVLMRMRPAGDQC
ncbi:AmpG family muropeptide MFS transporter [Methylicorpusculum sp.]|uniref:AmpG family muropeptide MFS transporter n=1 Tax=Methylicorpusculum sp. TaxID=2713644 RepID=UPI002731BBA9|nr:MFS transporter [Methylicorpusculum sp.]MDP2179250.1 MFS transporter [Methylicorpusculum sp.]MDP3530032.1 MFS transporter [Methylicorpusculum sp.]MDZ4152922.1 MFS transporter [Methylicorpusculum sp.]